MGFTSLPATIQGHGEHSVGFANIEVAIHKLHNSFLLGCAYTDHVSNMDWHPSCVVGVVETEEPWG